MSTAVSLLTACSTVDRLSRETATSTVTVADVAPNDLGRVMVFAADEEINRTVFVKNLNWSLKSRAMIREEQARCRVGLLRLKGRKARVRRYRNPMGDRELLDISP